MNWIWQAAALGPFQQGKRWLQESVGFDKQTLHIIVGFLVFALVMLLFRRRIWLALLMVSIAAIMGEVLDIYELIAVRGKSWADMFWPWHIEDLIATMAGPIILAATISMWQRSLEDAN